MRHIIAVLNRERTERRYKKKKKTMSKTSCEILFENNNTNRVFYGGVTIKGSVIITLHKEKIIKGIKKYSSLT